MLKTVKLITSIFLSSMLLGCFPLAAHLVTPTASSGLYTKIDSTAPGFGPVYVGLTRDYAERYLGQPLFGMDLDENYYVNVYRYELERGARDIIATDLLDVVTFGLGIYIVSPTDRFNGTFHLMAVTYRVEDKHGTEDLIVGITERLTNSPLAVFWSEKSKKSVLNSEWDNAIESASIAIALDAKSAVPMSTGLGRMWKKGCMTLPFRTATVPWHLIPAMAQPTTTGDWHTRKKEIWNWPQRISKRPANWA